MYNQISSIAGLVVLLSVIALPAQVAAGTGLLITTVNSSRAHPKNISYSTTRDGFEIRGEVRSHLHSGRTLGHVDIAIVDANGEIIKSGSSKLQRTHYSNKHQHRVAFNALFNELPTGATELRVRHHIGTEGH